MTLEVRFAWTVSPCGMSVRIHFIFDKIWTGSCTPWRRWTHPSLDLYVDLYMNKHLDPNWYIVILSSSGREYFCFPTLNEREDKCLFKLTLTQIIRAIILYWLCSFSLCSKDRSCELCVCYDIHIIIWYINILLCRYNIIYYILIYFYLYI